jgi:hypothetical protein
MPDEIIDYAVDTDRVALEADAPTGHEVAAPKTWERYGTNRLLACRSLRLVAPCQL